MKSLLVVIDLEKDFVNEYTEKFVSKIDNLIKSDKFDDVVFTKFVNNNDSIFYKKLKYRGCMNEDGSSIVVDTSNYKVFEKDGYTCLNEEFKKYLIDNKIDKIYLCGFDSSACVLKSAVDLFENNYNVYVLKDYCMSHEGVYYHEAAIKMLEIFIGSDYVI